MARGRAGAGRMDDRSRGSDWKPSRRTWTIYRCSIWCIPGQFLIDGQSVMLMNPKSRHSEEHQDTKTQRHQENAAEKFIINAAFSLVPLCLGVFNSVRIRIAVLRSQE